MRRPWGQDDFKGVWGGSGAGRPRVRKGTGGTPRAGGADRLLFAGALRGPGRAAGAGRAGLAAPWPYAPLAASPHAALPGAVRLRTGGGRARSPPAGASVIPRSPLPSQGGDSRCNSVRGAGGRRGGSTRGAGSRRFGVGLCPDPHPGGRGKGPRWEFLTCTKGREGIGWGWGLRAESLKSFVCALIFFFFFFISFPLRALSFPSLVLLCLCPPHPPLDPAIPALASPCH